VFTLKILSGPLYGSDITLAASTTFFVVGDRAIDAGARGAGDRTAVPLAASEHALYLPLAEDTPNFTMHLAQLRQRIADDVQTQDSVATQEGREYTDAMLLPLTIFNVDGIVEQDIVFNRPHQIGALWIAVKAYDCDWSDTVAQFLRDGAVAFVHVEGGANGSAEPGIPRALDARGLQDERVQNTPGLPRPLSRHLSRLFTSWQGVAFGALFVLLGVAALTQSASGRFQTSSAEKVPALPSPALMHLALNSTDAMVLPGRDDQVFLLVGSERIESWGRLLHRKGLHANNVNVRGIEQELQRANDVLDRAHIRYWVVRLDDPTHPNVLVHAGLQPSEKVRISELIIAHLPYVKQVAIEEVDPEAVIAEAEHRLKVSGVDYQIEHFHDRASIVISGALDDRQLRRIDQEARHFKNLWGDRFIQFSVQLAERKAGGIIKQQGPIMIRYQQDHIGFSG